MILTVHVQPNAKESKIVSWLDENTVKIKIAAPAKQGKANKALILFLAKEFGIPKTSIEIIRGATTRMKHVEIPDGSI